jgi:hypothetical protein
MSPKSDKNVVDPPQDPTAFAHFGFLFPRRHARASTITPATMRATPAMVRGYAVGRRRDPVLIILKTSADPDHSRSAILEAGFVNHEPGFFFADFQ